MICFTLNSIYMLYYVYWHVYAEQFLYNWNEGNLTMVYDLFNVLLSLIHYYVVDDFSIHIH
jgi:hypothetical protein